jgi:LytS/YehU family sensor histidine kinase
MGCLAEFVTKNYQVVEKLLKAGAVSITLKQQYEIYQYFNTTSHIKSRMQRYENTAEAMKVSLNTVRRAVDEMKKAV